MGHVKMQLSWTTLWSTTAESRMALFLFKDNNPMELIPDFLNELMDTKLMVQDEARRKTYSQQKKARRLVISAREKARKRSLSRQARGREVVHGGLYVKSKFPESTPMFNLATVSYGLSIPTPPPILAYSSKPLNLGLYNTERLVSEQGTSSLYVPQTLLSGGRPHALGSYQVTDRS